MALVNASLSCPRCHRTIQLGTEVCPHCGAATPVELSAPLTTPPARERSDEAERHYADRPYLSTYRSLFQYLDRPWIILCLAFFAMAVLALPVLWISRAFSAPAKLILSIVITLYTALIFWGFWLVMSWCWSRISPYL